MTKKMLALLKSNVLIITLAMTIGLCPLFCVTPVRADDSHHEDCHKSRQNKNPEVKYCCSNNGVVKAYDLAAPQLIVDVVSIPSLVPEIDLADSRPTDMQIFSGSVHSQAPQILRI